MGRTSLSGRSFHDVSRLVNRVIAPRGDLEPALAAPASVRLIPDRARRGVSGALYLQSALARPKFHSEGLAIGVRTPKEALTVRSRAT